MLSENHIKKLQQNMAGGGSALSSIFRALGDKTRFQTFSLLIKKEELCVTDVASVFSISIPAASYQLKILEMAGLVRRERSGQMICYEVKKESPAVQLVTKMLSL